MTDLWTQHFSAYELTDAVYGVVSCVLLHLTSYLCLYIPKAAAAVRNWRSKIGKIALKAVDTIITGGDYPTLENCYDYVHERLLDSGFVYEKEEEEVWIPPILGIY